MKKFTLLLFVAVVSINAGFAQQVNPKQKVTFNNPTAQKMIAEQKIDHHKLPFIFFNEPKTLLKSAASIKLDSVIISTLEPGVNNRKAVDKQLFFYDSENRLVRIEATNGMDSWWDAPQIVVFEYNKLNLVDTVKIWWWHEGSFFGPSFNVFNYDYSGRLLTATSYFDDNSIYYRISYTYDLLGRPVDLLMEDGWIVEGKLIPSYHHLTYNDNGQLIDYRATNLYNYLITYEWNADNNLIKETFEDFGWNSKKYSLYFYDSTGNRIRTERYGNYSNVNNWSLFDANEYNYLDLNYDDLVDLHLSLLMTSNEHDLIGYRPKNLISSSIKNGKKLEYFYSSVIIDPSVTEINDRQYSDFSVYPNPATNQVTFTWNNNFEKLNLKIYQVTGACVIDREITSNESVTLEGIPKGMYIYKLSDGIHHDKSGKLVIE
jgi:hypothetical protein